MCLQKVFGSIPDMSSYFSSRETRRIAARKRASVLPRRVDGGPRADECVASAYAMTRPWRCHLFMRILSRPLLQWQTLIPRCDGHVRRINSKPPSEPFKILFFGRDEFSCAVFERLHAAQGLSTALHQCQKCKCLTGLICRTSCTCADVWQGICIATHPDERVGRRGSQLSVCTPASPSLLLVTHVN